MSEIKNMKIEIIDNDHMYINNRHFISLERLREVRKEFVKEMDIIVDKNKELAEENEALRVLLKKQSCDESIIAVSNKICDHEWECSTISTAGTTYICRKCGARKTYSPNESDIVKTVATI